jgi:tetratricopeptide (TPR) repeat protein/O-antigen ligase
MLVTMIGQSPDQQGQAAQMRSATRSLARYEFLLLAAATPLLLFPGIWTLLGAAIIALAWASRWLATGRISKPTAMDFPILLLLLTLGVGLVPAIDLDLALNRLWIILLGVAWFYTVVNTLDTDRRIHLMGVGLVALGLGVAIFSLLSTDFETAQVVKIPAIYGRLPPPLIRGLPGSGVIEEYDLVNPRVVAGALAILIPIPLSYLALGFGWRLRCFSALSALVMAVVLGLTQAPQGLLGVTAALVLIGLCYSRWLRIAIPVGVIGLLAGGALWGSVGGIFGWLPSDAAEYLTGSLERRVGIWHRAVWMIRDMPFSGIGLNNYPRVAQLYTMGPNYDPHAHSTLLQTALDLGLPGLVAVLALLAGFGYSIARAWRLPLARNQRALLIGLCGTVAAWLGYGILDTLTLGHKSAVVLWIALGTAAALRLQVERPRADKAPLLSRRKRWLLAAPALLLVALALPCVVGVYHLNLGVMESHNVLASEDRSCAEESSELAVARTHLGETLRWSPGCARAHYWLGQLHACLGEQDEAIESLLRAVELDPGDELAHYSLGQLLHQSGDHDQAVREWSLAGAADELWYQARLLWADGNVDEAQGLLEAVTAIDPAIEDAWLLLGSSYEREQRWAEALQAYMDCLQHHPAEPEAYVRAAELLYSREGETTSALDLLEQALTTCEDTGPLYLSLARILQAEGRLEEAESMALLAAQASPESGEASILLGDLYASQQRYDLALQAYAAADRSDNWREHWSAHSKMGDTLLVTGQPGLAIQSYETAVAIGREQGLEPTSLARTYVGLGDALLEEARVDEAITAYEEALRLDPENVAACERLQALGQSC